MCEYYNEPNSAHAFLTERLETTQSKLDILTHIYDECVHSCQRMGGELAELEDLLFDEEGLEGEELADRVSELLEIKWMWDDLCNS